MEGAATVEDPDGPGALAVGPAPEGPGLREAVRGDDHPEVGAPDERGGRGRVEQERRRGGEAASGQRGRVGQRERGARPPRVQRRAGEAEPVRRNNGAPAS